MGKVVGLVGMVAEVVPEIVEVVAGCSLLEGGWHFGDEFETAGCHLVGTAGILTLEGLPGPEPAAVVEVAGEIAYPQEEVGMSVAGWARQPENRKQMFLAPEGYRTSIAVDGAWEARTIPAAVAAGLAETVLSPLECDFGDQATGYR